MMGRHDVSNTSSGGASAASHNSNNTMVNLTSAMQVVCIPDTHNHNHYNNNTTSASSAPSALPTPTASAAATAIAAAPRMDSIDMTDNDLLVGNSNHIVDLNIFDESSDQSFVPLGQQQQQNLLRTPRDSDLRPFDELGPPADPLEYSKPRIDRGKRADVMCYFPSTDRHEIVKNVLFRDFSKGTAGILDGANNNNNNNNRSRINNNNKGVDDTGDALVQQAYWPIPHKRPIKTIMGHVEICIVLERCISSNCGHDDHDDDDNSSTDSSAYDDIEEEPDIVFQLTQKRVAVKVNYAEKMEHLRNRHAEDPLKEIAAMQLIGDTHPNVLGCIDVLYDAVSRTLNVVMRFCEAGDLFELLQQQLHNHATASLDQNAPPLGMSEARARFWFRQVIAGVDYLHSVGICHRDLSPENVMIDKANQCLIIDMGMAFRVPYLDTSTKTPRIVDAREYSLRRQQAAAAIHTPLAAAAMASAQLVRRCLVKPQGACGKLPYMSPEIFRNRDPFCSEAVDLFTCGTILFCMLTGNRSFQSPHPSDPQFYWMTHGIEQLLADWNVTLSAEGLHLLKNLLQIDPRLRLSLQEVKHHPWFAFPEDPPPLPKPPSPRGHAAPRTR